MYKIIDESGNVYEQAGYNLEADFEKMVVSHADAIFGKDGIYFDIKKLIGKQKKGATIPDGYYLDLTFHKDPHLYLVEVELINHDVYAHIGEQLLRFGISSDQDKYRMKSILIEAINEDTHMEWQIKSDALMVILTVLQEPVTWMKLHNIHIMFLHQLFIIHTQIFTVQLLPSIIR